MLFTTLPITKRTISFLVERIHREKSRSPNNALWEPFWKNGALFTKEGTKKVPLWQSSPHKKGTVSVPLGHYFCMENIGRISALLQKGTKIASQRALFNGPSKGALWYHLFFSVYSGNQEFLGIEAGFNPEVQSQLEISFPPAATQLILMNVCFMDYDYSISCYLIRISDSLLSGF